MCVSQLAERPASPSMRVSNIIKDMIVKIHPRNALVRWVYVSGYAFLVFRNAYGSTSCTIEGAGFDIMTLPTNVSSFAQAKEAIAFEVMRLGDRLPMTQSVRKGG